MDYLSSVLTLDFEFVSASNLDFGLVTVHSSPIFALICAYSLPIFPKVRNLCLSKLNIWRKDHFVSTELEQPMDFGRLSRFA